MKILLNPFILIIGFPANLIDLEPFRLCSVELVTGSTGTLSHVGDHGTNVMRPRLAGLATSPEERHFTSGFCGRNNLSFPSVGATVHGGVEGTLDRRNVVDETNRAGVCGTVRHDYFSSGNERTYPRPR